MADVVVETHLRERSRRRADELLEALIQGVPEVLRPPTLARPCV